MRRVNLLTVWLWAGFAFLYLPIVVLVVYSFNANKSVAVWGGLSVKWYGELFRNAQILQAARQSLEVAAASASLAVFIGGLAGYVLARFGAFRGRTGFSAMLTAPLVMPEVITGLSLLMLFIAMEQALGWPEGRSLLTIIIAHITFASAYVAVVVRSRVLGLDRALEEAAMDLGARPHVVLWRITLPMLAPGLVSGWLLAFTLSLDDLVIASFVSGPGSTTLPMLIFSKVRLGVSPDINALASIIVLIVATGVILSGWMMLRAERAREREAQAAFRISGDMTKN
ncbi:MAG: ABC transporter permease subunit [Pseudomonadota bacterium]|nr:ABC transporter permease subunit [Pseudomonadota bacterium]